MSGINILSGEESPHKNCQIDSPLATNLHHSPCRRVACLCQILAGNQNALPINWFTQVPTPPSPPMSDLANSCHWVIIMSVTALGRTSQFPERVLANDLFFYFSSALYSIKENKRRYFQDCMERVVAFFTGYIKYPFKDILLRRKAGFSFPHLIIER